MDLLRWFRFLWAIEVSWDQATRAEARDFLCWIQAADKPLARYLHQSTGEIVPTHPELGIIRMSDNDERPVDRSIQ